MGLPRLLRAGVQSCCCVCHALCMEVRAPARSFLSVYPLHSADPPNYGIPGLYGLYCWMLLKGYLYARGGQFA